MRIFDIAYLGEKTIDGQPVGGKMPVFEITQGGSVVAHAVFWWEQKLQEMRGEKHNAMVNVAIMRGVARIEAMLSEEGWVPSGPNQQHLVQLHNDDFAPLPPDTKCCSYRAFVGRNIECTTAATTHDGPTALSAPSVRAATSLGICTTKCQVPDDSSLCSSFLSPRVFHQPGHNDWDVKVNFLCAKGIVDAHKFPMLCRPDGQKCWHKEFSVASAAEDAEKPSADIAESLDMLVLVLRAFKPLNSNFEFQIRNLTSPAGVAAGVVTIADLSSNLMHVSEMLGWLNVEQAALPPIASGDKDRYEKKNGLNRLELALSQHIADANDNRALALAFKRLRQVRNVRNAYGHPSSQANGRAALLALGLSWPTSNPPLTWSALRRVTANELTRIRHLIPAYN